MSNFTLDKKGNFIVQESVFLNCFSGSIFLALLLGVLITRNWERNTDTVSFYFIYLFLILGAVIFFVKANRNEVIMIINNMGIYYKGNFITNWENFINAHITQDDYEVSSNSSGVNDKFNIVVTCFQPTSAGDYMYKLAMSGSQNKSEYQIIYAIEYFSKKKLSLDIF